MAPVNRTAATPPLPKSESALPDRRRPVRPSTRRPAPSPSLATARLASQLASTKISASDKSSTSLSFPSSATWNATSGDSSFSPLSWKTCFDDATDVPVSSRGGLWRVYSAGFSLNGMEPPPLAVVLLHGGGHAALSWGLVASQLKPHVAVVAFDSRGHGHSRSSNDTNLDAESQVKDGIALLTEFFKLSWPDSLLPKLVVCGHSMGGAIAIRIAASQALSTIVGLVVIDVVEGTAMAALPHMSTWLAGRSRSFPSVERAIRYVTRAGFIRNATSARLSVPPQVQYSEERRCWVWRTALEETEQYWEGWFEGLSHLFLSVPVAKLLLLANVNRLDKDLMIAQMQGKFQNVLIPSAGHTIHEDQPEQTANALLEYLHRNLLIDSEDDTTNTPIIQQRKPIPPCC